MAHCSILAAFLTFLAGPAATRTYPPQFENADVHVYKQVGDVPLNLYVFNPPAADASQPGSKPAARPAIVFFFGGGWANGSPQQFEPHCRYFASRGMVAVAADYRVASRHGAKIVDCVEDAKSALRWVRSHAHELGVDPDRIVAAGGSAGGHIAACTGVLAAFDAKTEDQTISSKPTAMVLFNPVLSFVAKDPAAPDRRIASFAKRAGVEPSEVSPAQHVVAGAPPTLILIGTEDYVLPGCKDFAAAMKQVGNQCELKLYEGRAHGFFNVNRGRKDFLATLVDADRFLASLGILKGSPTADEYFKNVRPR